MAGSKKASSADPRRTVTLNGDERTVGNAISGSKAENFQRALLRQTLAALWTPTWKSEDELKVEAQAAIDALKGLAPRDEAEGMLATQMVATHNAAMECFRRAMTEGQTFEGREANLKHAQRLSKAYLDQLAALDKHRGRGQQKITVEHVTVEAGGQAIVGSVEAGAARGSGRPRSPDGDIAEAGIFEDRDNDAEGAASDASPKAVGDDPAETAKPIEAGAEELEAASRAKVRKRTRPKRAD